MLRSNRELRETFQPHFSDHFTRCPDPPVKEFRSDLADFSEITEVAA